MKLLGLGLGLESNDAPEENDGSSQELDVIL